MDTLLLAAIEEALEVEAAVDVKSSDLTRVVDAQGIGVNAAWLIDRGVGIDRHV